MAEQKQTTPDRRFDGAAQAIELPVICPWLAGDEIDRQARETARDAYRTALQMLRNGTSGTQTIGVQHVFGRVFLTVEVRL